MSVFTLQELDEQIAAYKAALKKLATSHQSMEIDGMKFTRADLPQVRKTLDWLSAERTRVLGRNRAVTVVGRPSR